MEPSRYPKSPYPSYESLGSLQPNATGLTSEPYPLFYQAPHMFAYNHAPADHVEMLYDRRCTTVYNPISTSPVRDAWYRPSMEHGPHGIVYSEPRPIGIPPFQLQVITGDHHHHAEKATQTALSDSVVDTRVRNERQSTYRGPTPRRLVSQVAYKPRRLVGFSGPREIEFSVSGVVGIRLSDASEGNWAGFDGRDDRSLFGEDRAQIVLRLQLTGGSTWQSKIPIKDFTKQRRPITRAKLAAEVAKRVKKFIASGCRNMNDVGHSQCPLMNVSLRRVYLTRFVRVSTASWQPELFVE
ncbi:hypothetical protein BJ322DRAFT_345406 [Thelephora terrestris]|uniref:Uncharacterized protein n=1 Tax=Thelephora terrestris TaxID=56493 RepID=A0A9P6L2V1_9AGAM|nr:hypothetical protein BJ322DRAFT_345406 [Thelephora terrestris]